MHASETAGGDPGHIQDRLHRLADNLPTAMLYQVMIGKNGERRFAYVSRSVERLHLVSVEAALAEPRILYDQIIPEHQAGFHAAEERALRDRQPFRYEMACRLPNGEVRWFELNSVPNTLADGRQVWDGLEVDITGRKRAEEALREREEESRSFFESAAVGAVHVDPGTYRLLQVNDRYCAITGYRRDELVGMSFLDITHPDERDDNRRRFDQLIRGERQDYCFEKRYLRKDGQVVWAQVCLAVVRDSDGRAVRASGVVQDITAQKQALAQRAAAEAALRESEANLRTLADNMAQLAWMADENGSIFWYNSRWYDYTGTAPEEVRGWGWRKVHHPEHVERVVEKIRRSFETGTVWEDTFPLRGKDGQYRWFLSRAVPIRDDGGCVIRWFGTNTDVTELRDAQDRLKDSHTLYRSRLAELQSIYKSAPIGLCVVDQELRYARINDRLADMHGLPAAEHLGRTVREVAPGLADAQEPILRSVLETGQPVIDFELSGSTRAAPGRDRYWLMSCYPIPDETGGTVGVNVTVQEITDRKRAEEERQALLEAEQAARCELERYNRLKDEFLATVSHELRSPLNAILGWTRLLAQGKAEAGRALEIIDRNASGLAQIVEDLLDMSRIISGKIHLERTAADIGPLTASVLDSVQLAAQAKSLTLHSWIDSGLRPITCDPNRVRQIIWNLLTNAVKFTPPGGRVWITVSQAEDRVEIKVKDTGQGIAPEFLPAVFGRFLQADSSTTRKHGGLGLGLAISKHLVELHGGTIQAESPGPGQGTTFTVRLPLAGGPTEAGESPYRRPPVPTRVSDLKSIEDVLAGVTVLVVDDDPDSCELAARILRDAGAEVHAACSAERGFEVLMDVRPDVLISDISMPQQDGYEFIRKIRSCGGWCAGLVCIALTALARPEDRTRILKAGYNEYVTKPFDATVLPVLVSQLAGYDQGSAQASGDERGRQPRPMEERRANDNRHILLAEDNAAVSEMLRLFLEGSGYRVTVVPTVEQALSVAAAEPVDLLLSDFRLKDGTGWQLIEQLRAVRPVPGVMLSGYSDSFYIDKSKAVGFSHYLVKPVDEEQLLQTVREALAQT